MALPTVGESNYPTPDELRDAILRQIKLAFQRRGLLANVLPGSDHYITADAIASRLALVVANNQIALEQQSPLTATGDDLDQIAGVYGVVRRPATQSEGFVKVSTVGIAIIPAGFQAVGPGGSKFATVSVNTVTNNDEILVQSLEAGTGANLDAGAILTWESASVGNLIQTCTVSGSGITGGADTDTDEELRERLIDRLSFTAVGGNAAFVQQLAEGVSAAVGDAWVYSAARGPGSYDVAVASAEPSRVLATSVVNSVASAVAGELPGHTSLNCTTVVTEPVDVVLAAQLPLPQFAGGAGGGWLDANPWPRNGDRGFVVAVTGTLGLRVYSPAGTAAAPIKGQKIAIYEGSTGILHRFTISNTPAFIAPSQVWDFDIFPQPTFDPTGHYVSADAQNLQDYVDTFVAETVKLGAGEKSDSPDLLPRALRFPAPDFSDPPALTSVILSRVLTEQPEILDISYALRIVPGSFVPTVPPPPTFQLRTGPSLPPTPADPPRILTLNNFAIVSV
ncbi:MAG: hypothetical protein CL484_00250 [Acidobacteria bacterium]|nr:hypothetical protein [Acidobacteriota bacterium]